MKAGHSSDTASNVGAPGWLRQHPESHQGSPLRLEG